MRVVRSTAAPGQYSVYMPASAVIENDPENPGGRFSFSPTMRSPSSTSTSLTAVASVFVTAKVMPPAWNEVRSGVHPFVAEMVTLAWRAGPERAVFELEQATSTPTEANDARTAMERVSMLRVLPSRCWLEIKLGKPNLTTYGVGPTTATVCAVAGSTVDLNADLGEGIT